MSINRQRSSALRTDTWAAELQRKWRGWALLVALMMLGIGFAIADEGADTFTGLKRPFDIPAQPLVTALQAYSAASGVHVLYTSGLEIGRMSTAVQGRMTPETALRQLLEDTDLVVLYSRADAITLMERESARLNVPPSPLAGEADLTLDTLHVRNPKPKVDQSDLADYVATIQKDVRTALEKAAQTRNGSFRVGLELWVDATRVVRRTHVFRSTGDTDRDTSVANTLKGLVLGRAAPPHTPQPVRVMITVQSM